MDGDSKYKLFRNYMVNELGITKEDIERWTKEAVTKAANDFIEHRFGMNNLDSYVMRRAKQEITNQLSSSYVKDVIASTLSNRLEINVKVHNPGGEGWT